MKEANANIVEKVDLMQGQIKETNEKIDGLTKAINQVIGNQIAGDKVKRSRN